MNKLKILIIVFIGFALTSCSSNDNKDTQDDVEITEDDVESPLNSILTLFPLESKYYQDDYLYINHKWEYYDDKKLKSYNLSNADMSGYDTWMLIYTDNLLSRINFSSQNNNFYYNVTTDQNIITLISSEENSLTLEIEVDNGFIDYIKFYRANHTDSPSETFFNRDTNDNLISIVGGDCGLYEFTSFDTGKKINPAPMYHPYYRWLRILFNILNLKTSENNPLSGTYIAGQFCDYTVSWDISLEYDLDGRVIMSTELPPDSNPNIPTQIIEHTYVDL